MPAILEYAEMFLDDAILREATGQRVECDCPACLMALAAETVAIFTYRVVTGRLDPNK